MYILHSMHDIFINKIHFTFGPKTATMMDLFSFIAIGEIKHNMNKCFSYCICICKNKYIGKSTLLKKLSANGFTVIPEPINDIWGNYLPQLYKDLKRWGFCFQMEAMDWFRFVIFYFYYFQYIYLFTTHNMKYI